MASGKRTSPLFKDQPPIYFETPVRELPGLFRKQVWVQPGEGGLVVEKGELRRVLPPGKHRVGWGFLGLGSRRRVGRLRSDPFTLPLRFYRLGEDTKDPLDAFTQASVMVADAPAFYRFGAEGRPRLTARYLGNSVSASIQVTLDRLATFFDPALLQADPKAGERLVEQVADPLVEQLRDRGLRLEKLYPLVFRPSRESEALLEEALGLQAEIASAGDKDWATLRQKVEQFAARALDVELASPSDVEAMRAAAGTRDDTSATGLLDAVGQIVRRLTGQAGERARRLPIKETARARPRPLAWITWLEASLTGLLVAAVVAAVPVYWLWYREEGMSWPAYLASFGAFIGGVRLMLMAMSEVEKRLKRREVEQEIGIPWFKRWLSKDAARVDELIREQVATEMESGAVAELEAAAALCSKAGLGKQGLGQLAEELRLLALNIRGAQRASTAFAAGGREALARGARLIAFEEETLRLARLIGSHASQVRRQVEAGGDATEDTGKLREAVGALSRHFASRAGVIAGVPYEPAPAGASG